MRNVIILLLISFSASAQVSQVCGTDNAVTQWIYGVTGDTTFAINFCGVMADTVDQYGMIAMNGVLVSPDNGGLEPIVGEFDTHAFFAGTGVTKGLRMMRLSDSTSQTIISGHDFVALGLNMTDSTGAEIPSGFAFSKEHRSASFKMGDAYMNITYNPAWEDYIVISSMDSVRVLNYEP